MTYRHNWSENRVYFYDDEGRLVSVPAQWTSILPPDPFVALSAGRFAFRIQDLLELVRFLAEMHENASRGEDAGSASANGITPPV